MITGEIVRRMSQQPVGNRRTCSGLIADIRNTIYVKCLHQAINNYKDKTSSRTYQTLCLDKTVSVEIRGEAP